MAKVVFRYNMFWNGFSALIPLASGLSAVLGSFLYVLTERVK